MDNPVDPWSATRVDVHRRLRALRDEGDGVLATVVDVEGSAYRRPGAKLVVRGDEHLGAITAGCLEDTLLDLATEVRAAGEPRVETFDLTDDDEWGIGLGCNGVIDVLLEPVDASFDATLDALAAKRPAALLTVVETPDDPPPGTSATVLGARATRTEDGEFSTTDARPAPPQEVLDALRPAADRALEEGTAGVERVTVDGAEYGVFVDGETPIRDLVLFGSQHDVHPVARLASQVGFRVVVASARGARSDASQFPHADEVRSVRAPDLASVVDADDFTSVVLLSHNFVDDRLALDSLLTDTDVSYIGLMGPTKRFERMQEELAEEGRTLTSAELDRIATPVGLDLGGGEPVEVAMSIVAEAMAVANGRDGGRLRTTKRPIHARGK